MRESSRPETTLKETQQYVNSIIDAFPATDARLDQIRREHRNDPVCQKVMTYCLSEWPDEIYNSSDIIYPYWEVRGRVNSEPRSFVQGRKTSDPLITTHRNSRKDT